MLGLRLASFLLALSWARFLAAALVAGVGEVKRDVKCTLAGADDISLLKGMKTNCSSIVLSGITVPAGVTLDLKNLQNGTTVTFNGTTKWGYKEWQGPLVSVSGIGISIRGTLGSVLDGNGSLYWDSEGGNGGKTKPKFFQAHGLINSTIDNILIKDSPVHVFSIGNCKNVSLINVTIDNRNGDRDQLGHNTDGFDISSSTNLTFVGAKVYNQDDCVAINSGTNITFRDGLCSGGHGLSIGSIGGRSDNTVDNILFENSVISNSQNGVRIKTKPGKSGKVNGVTYRNITLTGITKYGITVDQAYGDKSAQPTSGIPITNFTLENVSGTVAASGINVYIDCGSTGCSQWSWTKVSVTGGKKNAKCAGVPSGISC